MEKFNWTDHVKNEEVLYRVKEDTSVLPTVRRKRQTLLITSSLGTLTLFVKISIGTAFVKRY